MNATGGWVEECGGPGVAKVGGGERERERGNEGGGGCSLEEERRETRCFYGRRCENAVATVGQATGLASHPFDSLDPVAPKSNDEVEQFDSEGGPGAVGGMGRSDEASHLPTFEQLVVFTGSFGPIALVQSAHDDPIAEEDTHDSGGVDDGLTHTSTHVYLSWRVRHVETLDRTALLQRIAVQQSVVFEQEDGQLCFCCSHTTRVTCLITITPAPELVGQVCSCTPCSGVVCVLNHLFHHVSDMTSILPLAFPSPASPRNCHLWPRGILILHRPHTRQEPREGSTSVHKRPSCRR